MRRGYLFYDHPEDLALSGPGVWPKLIIEKMPDIFIVQRPELTYIQAIRRIREIENEMGLEKSIHIRMNIACKRSNGKIRLAETIFSKMIWHYILDDPKEDVKKILLEIREILCQMMPDDPDPFRVVCIRFFIEISKVPVSSYEARWV